MGRAILIKERK